MSSARVWLNITLNDLDQPRGKATAIAIAIQILIVISLFSIPVQTLPDLPAGARWALDQLEIAIVAIFTAEYIGRVLCAKPARSFIFSFWGLVDLLAILPFYVEARVDLRAVRAFRLLRIVRILKLARYSRAAHRLGTAVSSIREELILFGVVSVMVLYLAALGIYYFEREAQPEAFASAFHAMWWAIVTLTTVGYGDVYPITWGGKLFTSLILIVGLGVVAVPTGLLASALERTRSERDDSKDP